MVGVGHSACPGSAAFPEIPKLLAVDVWLSPQPFSTPGEYHDRNECSWSEWCRFPLDRVGNDGGGPRRRLRRAVCCPWLPARRRQDGLRLPALHWICSRLFGRLSSCVRRQTRSPEQSSRLRTDRWRTGRPGSGTIDAESGGRASAATRRGHLMMWWSWPASLTMCSNLPRVFPSHV